MDLTTLDSRFSTITGMFLVFCLAGCQPGGEADLSDAPAGLQTSAVADPVSTPESASEGLDPSVAMPSSSIPTFSTEYLARKSSYYVGGDYVGDPPVMGGQMYVEVWEPHEITQPYPMVLFHGNGQTGVDWLQTPDGRAGWAYYLIAVSYTHLTLPTNREV